MSALHTLHRSWHDAIWQFEQLAFASSGDAILLIQDAVLATQSANNLGSFLAKCKVLSIDIFVLSNDCQLRGIENKYPQIKPIDYCGFVKLVEQHDKQIAW